MNLPWITVTPNLLEGICLINSLSKECFKQILLSQAARNENFMDDDTIELQLLSTDLTHNEVTHIMQTVRYITKQVSKIITKPSNLQCHLTEAMNLQSEKAEEVVKLWAEETIKSFNLDNHNKLEAISWDLHLDVASGVCPVEVVPHARIQFALARHDGNEKEGVHLDLDEEELLSLYKSIENIQVKLDSIQA